MDQFSVALVGNPNCGKTTLFNSLTGQQSLCGQLGWGDGRKKSRSNQL